jgi:hypothetical protein
MHLLVEQFLDYLLCDGSHGWTKYGWKNVPVCIITSGGWTVPIGSVLGLEEDKESLNALIDLMRKHCEFHGVPAPQFNFRSPTGNWNAMFVYTLTTEADDHDVIPVNPIVKDWTRKHLRLFLYPEEYDNFMYLLHCKEACDTDLMEAFPPRRKATPVLHSDAGPAFVGLVKWDFCVHRFFVYTGFMCRTHLHVTFHTALVSCHT